MFVQLRTAYIGRFVSTLVVCQLTLANYVPPDEQFALLPGLARLAGSQAHVQRSSTYPGSSSTATIQWPIFCASDSLPHVCGYFACVAIADYPISLLPSVEPESNV